MVKIVQNLWRSASVAQLSKVNQSVDDIAQVEF